MRYCATKNRHRVLFYTTLLSTLCLNWKHERGMKCVRRCKNTQTFSNCNSITGVRRCDFHLRSLFYRYFVFVGNRYGFRSLALPQLTAKLEESNSKINIKRKPANFAGLINTFRMNPKKTRLPYHIPTYKYIKLKCLFVMSNIYLWWLSTTKGQPPTLLNSTQRREFLSILCRAKWVFETGAIRPLSDMSQTRLFFVCQEAVCLTSLLQVIQLFSF